MAIGMAYDEYWHGDTDRLAFYRGMQRLKEQERNHWAWLQGAYVYEALIDCAPQYNPFFEDNTPRPYREKPFEISNAPPDEGEGWKERQDAIRMRVEAYLMTHTPGDGEENERCKDKGD